MSTPSESGGSRFVELGRRLQEDGLRALVVLGASGADANVAPFIGRAHLTSSVLIQPAGAAAPRLGYFSPMERDGAAETGLQLLTPENLDMLRWVRDGATPDRLWANVVSRALHLCEVAPGPLALAGSFSAGRLSRMLEHLAAEGWSFVAGETYVEALRKAKTARELDAIETVCRAQEAAYCGVAAALRETVAGRGGILEHEGRPLTVGHLRRRVATVFADHGLEQPHGNIIAPAEQGAVPHNVGSDDRALRLGESLVVDLFPKGSLYGDCTRTFCVGEPSPALRRAFQEVEGALRAAEDAARPGVSGWDLQELVCRRFDGAGYATPITAPSTEVGYVHGLGHGVGYELHELPSFRRNLGSEQGTLTVGDVFTLEPGLYDPQAGWGVRLENLYVMEAEGPRNLTAFNEGWDPERWS